MTMLADLVLEKLALRDNYCETPPTRQQAEHVHILDIFSVKITIKF